MLYCLIVIFEISALKYVLLQNLAQEIKILKFGSKNARFPYFWAGISKYYCLFEISVLEFVFLQSLVQA